MSENTFPETAASRVLTNNGYEWEAHGVRGVMVTDSGSESTGWVIGAVEASGYHLVDVRYDDRELHFVEERDD